MRKWRNLSIARTTSMRIISTVPGQSKSGKGIAKENGWTPPLLSKNGLSFTLCSACSNLPFQFRLFNLRRKVPQGAITADIAKPQWNLAKGACSSSEGSSGVFFVGFEDNSGPPFLDFGSSWPKNEFSDCCEGLGDRSSRLLRL
jgi:hypothetical protein